MNKQGAKISMEEKLSTECLRIDRCQMSMHILCEQLWRSGRKAYTSSGASITFKDAWVSRGYRSLGYVSRVVCAVWTSACMVSYKISGAPPLTCGRCANLISLMWLFWRTNSDLWCHPYVPHYEATAQWSGHSNFPVNAALLLEKMMLMDQTDGLLSTW